MICLYRTLDSTQDEIKRIRKAGMAYPDFGIVRALEQTKGRGRYDRQWLSEAEKNALFSFGYAHHTPLRDAYRLYQMAAVALAEALQARKVNAVIKFPNDILVKGKKIAGILIENMVREGHIYYSIAGVGLNVNQEHFPRELQAVSVLQLTGKYSLPEDWMEDIVSRFRLLRKATAEEIQQKYLYYWQFKGTKKGILDTGGRPVPVKQWLWETEALHVISHEDRHLHLPARSLKLYGENEF